MRALRHWIAGMLMAALTGVPVMGQAAEKLYRIAGVVTNSVTGEPVVGATMGLTGSGANQQETIRTAQTDADGRFAMEPVPAGKYSLGASRRGYLTEQFNEHGSYNSAIVTGEGQDTEHIPFRLDPGAMVRCVVTDDAGDPVEGASVLLGRKGNDLGLGESMQSAGAGQTDDTGLFEFGGLMPGTYFVAVKAEPWFAMHMPRQQQNDAENQSRAEMMALDVAYPVTYYDGAMDESMAVPISVKSGERVEADVALHAVPALHLSAPLAGQSGGRRQWPTTTMRQTILGNEQFGGQFVRQSVDAKSGEIEFSGVAPGHYMVMEGNPPREMEFDATGNQQLDLSAGVPTFDVTIRARMADGSPLPLPLALILFAGNSTHRLSGQVDRNGDAQVNGVPSGEWDVQATGGMGVLGVVSVQTGTAEPRADSRVVVKDHPLTVNVVLAQGKTNVEGFAAKAGKNEAGVMIVLVPKDPTGQLLEFRRDQTDSDGSFSLNGAVPGEYTVVAIEDGWELEWAKPEVIGRYLKNGVAVTVPMNGPAVMKLGKSVVVQEK
jgi:5-hydroxyisourate hydrolase-like protein (transthyretin family)